MNMCDRKFYADMKRALSVPMECPRNLLILATPLAISVGQGGDLTPVCETHPNTGNQIPLLKVGCYWGFDTYSVTMHIAAVTTVPMGVTAYGSDHPLNWITSE